MSALLLGLGMVCVIEGLVLALASLRLEQILQALAEIGPERRRVLGLIVVALGVGLVALARQVAG